VSLNAKHAKLTPLSEFREDAEDKDDDDLTMTGFYDIKIHNENKETIDYNLFKSFKKSHSYVSIPFNLNTNKAKSAISSESSSSMICTSSSYTNNTKSEESLNVSTSLSSSPGSMSPLSSVSNSSLPGINPAVTHIELSDCLPQPIRVEYVPKGKIITINVSIMW